MLKLAIIHSQSLKLVDVHYPLEKAIVIRQPLRQIVIIDLLFVGQLFKSLSINFS